MWLHSSGVPCFNALSNINSRSSFSENASVVDLPPCPLGPTSRDHMPMRPHAIRPEYSGSGWIQGMEAAFDRQEAAIAVALPHLLSAARARLVAQAHKIASSAAPGISGSEAGNLFRGEGETHSSGKKTFARVTSAAGLFPGTHVHERRTACVTDLRAWCDAVLTGTGRKHAADLEDVETVAAFVRKLTEGQSQACDRARVPLLMQP